MVAGLFDAFLLIAGLFDAYRKASSTKMIAGLFDAYSLLEIETYKPSSVVCNERCHVKCNVILEADLVVPSGIIRKFQFRVHFGI